MQGQPKTEAEPEQQEIPTSTQGHQALCNSSKSNFGEEFKFGQRRQISIRDLQNKFLY